jgi:hypothetical protein
MMLYMLTIYIIHVECDDIMFNRHLWWDAACNFIYATSGILAICVGCNLFFVTNYNCKLKLFFWCELTLTLIQGIWIHKNISRLISSSTLWIQQMWSTNHQLNLTTTNNQWDNWWSNLEYLQYHQHHHDSQPNLFQ